MSRYRYPKNRIIRNGLWADVYLFCLRKKINLLARLIGNFLGCDISPSCQLPQRLFLAHPNGIVVGSYVKLGENVVLNHQTTLGGKNPFFHGETNEFEYPILEEGVYVGAGARILGHITIGKWSIIGANSVITKDVPSFSIVVGYNKIIGKSE